MRLPRRRGVQIVLRSFLESGLDAPPFRDVYVAAAPTKPGVYFLYRRDRVIYIGVAVRGTGIRQELEKHLQGRYGPRTQSATAFDFEQTDNPVVASHDYLAAHMDRHAGRPPVCNLDSLSLA